MISTKKKKHVLAPTHSEILPYLPLPGGALSAKGVKASGVKPMGTKAAGVKASGVKTSGVEALGVKAAGCLEQSMCTAQVPNARPEADTEESIPILLH